MYRGKRTFDLVLALTISALVWPLLLIVVAVIWIVDGGHVFYVSERMSGLESKFKLIKFRTMVPSVGDTGVSGGHKLSRLTKTGPFLRKFRIDEVPQLWNVIRGDMSFVGPRPPLEEYVRHFPRLYELVLISRPGVTGLASILYHRHEERLLSRATNAADADRLYRTMCVPRKARIDLIYQYRSSLKLDVAIMIKTVFRRMPIRMRGRC